MNILDELDLNNPKKFREYAVTYSCDELLDALSQCDWDPKMHDAIVKILDIQRDLSDALNIWIADDLNLKILLDKFYANPDHYSLRNRFLEVGAKDPEWSFKVGLLKAITLVLEGETLSEDLQDLFDEFKIDVKDISLLNRLKVELELNLKAFYSKKANDFQDISTNSRMQELLEKKSICMSKFAERRFANGRLDDKNIISWHCAFNDWPSGLKLFGENVVEYSAWDDYIPCENHATTLDLVDKIYNCSIEELEQLYNKEDDDLSFWKNLYKNDRDGYKLHLIQRLSIEMVDLIWMYEKWDRFMVVKGTYRGKEVLDGKLISCRYVDIYSQKTWKVYRALSN